ncbi:MAG: hypothetical protein WAT91_17745, partial [Saprospiraceae bacterium]
MMTTGIESLLHFVILTPLFVWGIKRNKTSNLTPILFCVLFYVVTNLLLSAFSNLTIFQGQQWNWFGKSLALIAGLLFIAIIPGFTKSSFSITSKINWTDTKPLLALCFIYFLIRVGLYAVSGGATLSINPETTLYQATLPGLQEELLYRGILL